MDLVQRAQEQGRMVKGWWLRSDVPLTSDKRARQEARADVPDFPFAEMEVNESFEVTPKDLGLTPCPHCGDTKLLETANIVSRAASKFKYDQRGADNFRDFATRQIGGRLVRCHRTL